MQFSGFIFSRVKRAIEIGSRLGAEEGQREAENDGGGPEAGQVTEKSTFGRWG